MSGTKHLALCMAALLAGGIFSACNGSADGESSLADSTAELQSTSSTTSLTNDSTTGTHSTASHTTESQTDTTSATEDTTVTENTTLSSDTTVTETETTTSLTTTTEEFPDTEAPILLNGGWGTTILQGSDFDLNDWVGYADFYDPTPVLTYTGEVDTSTCGKYPICATVTDAAGNALSWELTVSVVESMPTGGGGGASPNLSFDSFMAQHAAEGVRFGIDVSRWQEDVDFEAVKAAGASFVIMRIGYYYDEINMDEYYLRNIAAAKDAGLEVGVYLYTIANTEEEIRQNASWIAEQLDGMELDFPVAFDWERFGNFQQFGMSIRDLNELFLLFAEEMEGYGYSAMLYSSKTYLENFWYVQQGYPVWLAHYTSETDYAGEYILWQRSCRGRIDGIDTDVDFNILYESELAKW